MMKPHARKASDRTPGSATARVGSELKMLETAAMAEKGSIPKKAKDKMTGQSTAAAQTATAVPSSHTAMAGNSTLDSPIAVTANGSADALKALAAIQIRRIDASSSPYETSHGETVILIIVMEKKLLSKPMREILARLSKFHEFDICYLAQSYFLTTDPDQWPTCDCLIAFYSSGYPLSKVQQYAKRVKPTLVNDLDMQILIQDRRKVFATLKKHNVPVPKHVIISDNPAEGEYHWDDIEEHENALTLKDGTVLLQRPFVEKPANAEVHDIFIYFADSEGGGCQKLFRKTNDRCSEYIKGHVPIKRKGTKIYETFVATGGTDVKVYAVTGSYAHAEGRKAPVVDGKVLRDATGKELRCPVLLSMQEKAIARDVVHAFGQTVCGFDLLRDHDRSYVCDVNGWSFVKRAASYFDDCSQLLRKYITSHCAKASLRAAKIGALRTSIHEVVSREDSMDDGAEFLPQAAVADVRKEVEVVGVIAIIRHGERTPKQKAKLKTKLKTWVELYNSLRKGEKEVKIKSPSQLTMVMKRVRRLLMRATGLGEAMSATSSGTSSGEDIVVGEEAPTVAEIQFCKTLLQVLERYPLQGINRKVQVKPISFADGVESTRAATKVEVVVKWGGELTPHGLKTAAIEGERFRKQLYVDDHGGGLLRLHSTFRHDLKVYSSEEGRVQTTAAAFAKGLLALDGEVPAILVSLVRKGPVVNEWLDDSSTAKKDMKAVKARLHSMVIEDKDVSELPGLNPENVHSIAAAMRRIGNPRKALYQLKDLMVTLDRELGGLSPATELYDGELLPQMHERWGKGLTEFYDPVTDMFNVSKIPDVFDLARYDYCHNLLADIRPTLTATFVQARDLAHIVVPQEYGMTRDEKLRIARSITEKLRDKILYDLRIAANQPVDSEDFKEQCTRFMPQGAGFLDDKVKSPQRNIRSRIYITSESHLYAMLELLRWGGYTESVENNKNVKPEGFGTTHLSRAASPSGSVKKSSSGQSSRANVSDAERVASGAAEFEHKRWHRGMTKISKVGHLGELSQIVCRVFERTDLPLDSPDRHFVEWLVSPGQGAHDFSPEGEDGIDLPTPPPPPSSAPGYIACPPPVSPLVRLHCGMPLSAVEEFLGNTL